MEVFRKDYDKSSQKSDLLFMALKDIVTNNNKSKTSHYILRWRKDVSVVSELVNISLDILCCVARCQ